MLLETEELYMKMVMPENEQYTLNTTLYPNVPPTTDGHINNIAPLLYRIMDRSGHWYH